MCRLPGQRLPAPRMPDEHLPALPLSPCPALQAERWLEFLLSRKGRDGPLFIRKWLREAARKVGVLSWRGQGSLLAE